MVSLSLTYLPHGEEHIILLDGFFFLLLEFDFSNHPRAQATTGAIGSILFGQLWSGCRVSWSTYGGGWLFPVRNG